MRKSNRLFGSMAAAFGVICFIALAAVCFGAEASDKIGAEVWTWKETIKAGGWLMYVIAAMSVLMVTFVIYFIIILRPRQIAPAFLYKELMQKIKDGALDDVRRICEFKRCPLSSVVLSAMNYIRSTAEPDALVLKDVVEGEGVRQAEDIIGLTHYLLDIAVIAPMVGLLGTVFGMLNAFNAVALDIAKAKPMVLAGGVAQALITTAFGLIVGIPAMMFYAYFRRRASKVISYLEVATTDILTALMGSKSS